MFAERVDSMIILGLDPGTATTGVGIIQVLGNQFRPINYGIISTPADLAMEKRLVMIYEQITEIIETYRPDQVAIEKLFFNQNITTGITVGQARCVALGLCPKRFADR